MTWIFAAVGIIVLVVLHEMGHMFAAQAMGMKVTRFSLFFPPYVWKRQLGETELTLGTIPLGGSVRILGFSDTEEVDPAEEHRTYRAAAPWRQIVAILAGPVVNLVICIVLIWVFFFFVGPSQISTKVESIASGSPAAAQLRSGDRIVSVNGIQGDAERLSQLINEARCTGAPTDGCSGRPLTLDVLRDGEQLSVVATPRYDRETKRMRLGLVFGQERVKESFMTSWGYGFQQLWVIAKATALIPYKVFTPERKELGSIVGAYETTRQTAEVSFWDALAIIAVVSGALGLINLLPLGILDGGHIVVALIYWVRGKRVSMKAQERWGALGLILILVLFAIGLTNDIGRLFDGTLGQLRQ